MKKTLHKLGLRERLRQAIKDKEQADAFVTRLMVILDATCWKHGFKQEECLKWTEQYLSEMKEKGTFVPAMPLFVGKKESDDQPAIPSPTIEATATVPNPETNAPRSITEPAVAPPTEPSPPAARGGGAL